MRRSIPFEVYGSATSCLITEESPAPTVIPIYPNGYNEICSDAEKCQN